MTAPCNSVLRPRLIELGRAIAVCVAVVMPLAVSTPPAALVLAVAGLLLLLLGREGNAVLAGGACLVAEVAVAIGQADTTDALVTGGVVGAVVVGFSAVTTGAPGTARDKLGSGVVRELVLGGGLAAIAAFAPGDGRDTVIAGLIGAAAIVAAIAVTGGRRTTRSQERATASGRGGSDGPHRPARDSDL